MSTINITNTIFISKDAWNAIQETLYLNSIPEMTNSIIDGASESLDECISEDMINW